MKGPQKRTGKGEGGGVLGRMHSDPCRGPLAAGCRQAFWEVLSRGSRGALPWGAGDRWAWCITSISQDVMGLLTGRSGLLVGKCPPSFPSKAPGKLGISHGLSAGAVGV